MDSRMRRTPPGVTQDAIVCCLRSSGVAGAGEVRCGRALAPFSKLHPGRERKSNSGEARASVRLFPHARVFNRTRTSDSTSREPSRSERTKVLIAFAEIITPVQFPDPSAEPM